MIKTISARNSQGQPSTNADLQDAVDEIAQNGGGTLEIKAGIYQMHDALHLKSGVRVVGETGAILRKTPSVCSALADYLGYGFYEFTVCEPDLFHVGMGVLLWDDNASGFYTTAATITQRVGDTFFINRPFNHDYLPQSGGVVASLFSLIEGVGVRDISVENIALDGNPDETRSLNGCRGGGVFLLGCHHAKIENIEVFNYFGDAISFQQCTNIHVLNCHLHHNKGTGLHPGSGTVGYVMRGNKCHHNTGFGLFYCLRTTHSNCLENILENNGEDGISVGERDSDHFISQNTIRHNAKHGVNFREALANGGDRVILQENIIGPNCAHMNDENKAEIFIESGLKDIHIFDNSFAPNTHPVLRVESNCKRISMAENTVSGRAQNSQDITGAIDCVELTKPQTLPRVGPDALEEDGALHLGIEKLPFFGE